MTGSDQPSEVLADYDAACGPGSFVLLTRSWRDVLGPARFDAVVLISAAHYFDSDDLVHAHRQALASLVPGGLYVIGDDLAVTPWCTELQAAATASRPVGASWRDWWSGTGAAPARTGDHLRPAHELLAGPEAAGFERCSTIWQRFASHVVVAAAP